ncbi:MAG: hypothetical protein P1U56_04405 [Saprospiraceae bacterium]|nr:hypothetical protein [Saprospiraceae bacterium]
MKQFNFLKFYFLTAWFMLLGMQTSLAQEYDFLIGARLGTYISGSVVKKASEGRTYEAMIGITREANQSDYVFGAFYKFHVQISEQLPSLNWYAGGGAYMKLSDITGRNVYNFSPSIISGMEYTLEDSPVNFFIDVSPYYRVNGSDDSRFNIHANVGVRYIW